LSRPSAEQIGSSRQKQARVKTAIKLEGDRDLRTHNRYVSAHTSFSTGVTQSPPGPRIAIFLFLPMADRELKTTFLHSHPFPDFLEIDPWHTVTPKSENIGLGQLSSKYNVSWKPSKDKWLPYSVLSKAELYAKCKMLLSKPCADRSYCPGKDFCAESGRLAALAGRQQ
jgi:hypothetical protein